MSAQGYGNTLFQLDLGLLRLGLSTSRLRSLLRQASLLHTTRASSRSRTQVRYLQVLTSILEHMTAQASSFGMANVTDLSFRPVFQGCCLVFGSKTDRAQENLETFTWSRASAFLQEPGITLGLPTCAMKLSSTTLMMLPSVLFPLLQGPVAQPLSPGTAHLEIPLSLMTSLRTRVHNGPCPTALET